MSIAAAAPRTRRAIGIVRVSQTDGREGDSFASPGEQADRIRSACSRNPYPSALTSASETGRGRATVTLIKALSSEAPARAAARKPSGA